jgi:hypothetical protein
MAAYERNLQRRQDPKPASCGAEPRVRTAIGRTADQSQVASHQQCRMSAESSVRPTISLATTRLRSGIVRAMLPCNTFGRGAAPSAKEACARLVVDRDTTLATRPARPGPSAPQEGQYDFEATISPSGVQASAAFTYPAPSSDAAHTAADGNRTVTPTMPRAQFCLPMSGTYPLASHFRFMAVAANGAADARGR